MIVAGIDVGNSTTEVALATYDEHIKFIASGINETTGLKGTPDNIIGILNAIKDACYKAKIKLSDIDICGINRATPVIGSIAMQNITETIITESSMIGHNPDTPGGLGIGVGYTTSIDELQNVNSDKPYIVIVPSQWDYEKAAKMIKNAINSNINIKGAIVQNNDGVLISNRLNECIPIIDEVKVIEKIPLNSLAAIEVAPQGQTVKTLSNPYGIATVLNLTPEQTKQVVPIAKAMIGKRSGVVILTPGGELKERIIPAGTITLEGDNGQVTLDIKEGADAIMKAVKSVGTLSDVKGENGTNIGTMLYNIKSSMSKACNLKPDDIKISDIYAVDTLVPLRVKGGLANEIFMENGVAIAAMVRSNDLHLEELGRKLEEQVNKTVIAGYETIMALLGTLSTPGTDMPIAIVDIGGGSIDAAYMGKDYKITSVNLAGAGNLVTMLLNEEFGLHNLGLAEELKKYPLAKAESLFHIRMEDGSTKFFKRPLSPELFARVLLLKDNDFVPLEVNENLEKIRRIRREIKYDVLVKNSLRALESVAPQNNLRNLEYVVMIGGSSLDFELSSMLTDVLVKYGIVVGRGNIRGCKGPRNAVATGLVVSLVKGIEDGKYQL